MNTSSLNINTRHPAIRISLGKRMSINKRVLYALGNPENIHFWWGKSNRVLLIGDARKKTPMSIKIDDCYYNTKNGLKIENRKFVQTIINIAGLCDDIIYIVKGEYILELNMVAFKLEDAVELEAES